ncbi:TetR/AcrR family transcriptional regulator C-terminal ligand-binding domain-containing protein [Streptomyces sp. NPDC091279]|uniref:TetR/AcrR family transcriptional regulator C-terminal ligand-binding domain-containing protein n=1 Tax=Streptomyces sp. NPDC091279 TaxID=3365983 RepID=UPI0037F68C47
MREQVVAAHRGSGYGVCPLGVFARQVDEEPELSAILAELSGRWERSLADLVARARERGRVRADVDPVDAGRLLLAAVQGGVLVSHVQWRSAGLEGALDAALAVLTAEDASPAR